jgi:hypothetical protein
MASIHRNGPKTGLLLDLKLNKINNLDCMAEREGSKLSHNKRVTHHISENTPENTSPNQLLQLLRNNTETCNAVGERFNFARD